MTARLRTDTVTIDEASNDLANSLNNWFTKWGPSVIFKTCENCRHMTEGDEPAYCKRYNMVPPARIMLVGCAEHDDKEEVPF